MIVVGMGQKNGSQSESEFLSSPGDQAAVRSRIEDRSLPGRRIPDQKGIHPHVAIGCVESLEAIQSDGPWLPDPRRGHGQRAGIERECFCNF